jgi:hypothetical protein
MSMHISMNLASLSTSGEPDLLIRPETRPRTPINCGTRGQGHTNCRASGPYCPACAARITEEQREIDQWEREWLLTGPSARPGLHAGPERKATRRRSGHSCTCHQCRGNNRNPRRGMGAIGSAGSTCASSTLIPGCDRPHPLLNPSTSTAPTIAAAPGGPAPLAASHAGLRCRADRRRSGHRGELADDAIGDVRSACQVHIGRERQNRRYEWALARFRSGLGQRRSGDSARRGPM